MRRNLLSGRVPTFKTLIVLLLIANLLVGGAQIALSGDGFEGGDPPPPRQHLGCADLQGGAVRVFRDLHTTFGTNAPHNACTPNEYPISIFFGHSGL